MYAIVETGGKQYRVSEGDIITVEKIAAEDGATVELSKVLLLGEGDDIKVGTPYLDGTVVTAEVVESGKGKKVIVFKYKSKKDYRKKQGHRQPYTMLKITSLGGKPSVKKAEPKEEKVETEAPEEAKGVSLSMKKEELLAYAEEHGIDVDAKATKAEIIEAIEAATK